MNKKRVVTIIIVVATVILAGVAVFTAMRLFQLRQEAVAPTAPTSQPAAAQNNLVACEQLAFTVSAEEPTDTPTPTTTPTESPTSSPTPTPTSTATTTAAPTATPTADPELPEAGVSIPTLISAGLGILVILGSFLLIF